MSTAAAQSIATPNILPPDMIDMPVDQIEADQATESPLLDEIRIGFEELRAMSHDELRHVINKRVTLLETVLRERDYRRTAIDTAKLASRMLEARRDRAVRIHKNVKLVSTVAGRRDRRIDGGAEALDYLVHIVGTDNEGRREQHVVSAHAVGGAASRITHQSSRHGLALDAGVEFERGIERLLGLTVLDQFDTEKQPAAADITDMGVLRKPVVERTA